MINNSIWVYANTANTLSFHMQYDTIPIISIPLALQIQNLLCCQESLHSFVEINKNSAAEVLRNPWLFKENLRNLRHLRNPCSNIPVVSFSLSLSKEDNLSHHYQSTFFFPCSCGSGCVQFYFRLQKCFFRNLIPFPPVERKAGQKPFFLSCGV